MKKTFEEKLVLIGQEENLMMKLENLEAKNVPTIGEFLSDYSDKTLKLILKNECPGMTKMVRAVFESEIKGLLIENAKLRKQLKKAEECIGKVKKLSTKNKEMLEY